MDARTILAIEESSLDMLPQYLKSLLFYGIDCLYLDCQRQLWKNQVDRVEPNPYLNEDQIKIYENVMAKIQQVQQYILQNNKLTNLSLLTHFAPSK